MKLEKVVDTMKVYQQRRGGRVAEGAPLLREYAVYPVSRVRIPLSPPPCLKIPELDEIFSSFLSYI